MADMASEPGEENGRRDEAAAQRFHRLMSSSEEENATLLPAEDSIKDGDTAPLRLSSAPLSPPPFGAQVAPADGGGTQPLAMPPAITPAGPAQPVTTKLPPAHPVQSPSAAQPPRYPPPPGRPVAASPAPRPPASARPGGNPPPPTIPPGQAPHSPYRHDQAAPHPPYQRPPGPSYPGRPVPPPSRPRRSCLGGLFSGGCLVRGLFFSVFGIVLIALCGLSIVFLEYFRIARTLPDIGDLRQHAAQFETTRILDRNGDILYEINDPNAGKRTFVPLARISPALLAATIATEDSAFYSHPGFDVLAILRAFYQNYTSGATISGASTITQQLARNLLFTPSERTEQTYERKMREAVLAAEITRRYSKDEILEIYLNDIYYGNLAYGIEAASETYFGTSADKLTLGQAAFLAGLPQAPAIYDVYTNPDAALVRQRDVLRLMFDMSLEQDCIYVSNTPQKVCVDAVAATNAAAEVKKYPFQAPEVHIRYPHWVMYVRSLLEAQYDAQTIYKLGYSVYTTLDPELQDMAQTMVGEQVRGMAANNTKSGALVAIRPATGEILAMVGSADFYNEAISGQVNMAISPRQPGSSIKPLTYLAAFEKGWTPATLIWDVPSEFPPSGRADDQRPPYVPQNYDGRYRGPVTVREALANSLNIPAVKTLQFVGVYDDPNRPGDDGLVNFARRQGITTLNQEDYGLSLTLGGGEVTLQQMTGFYATLANNGRRIPPVAIQRILDHSGNVVYQYQPPPGEQTVRVEHAFLMSSILADAQSRVPAFGANSALDLPFPAAVKTGTTNDFRDNWTLGYTPDLAVGVWVGNPDYTQMVNTTGLSGAAPIWNRFMAAGMQKLTGGNLTQFSRPPGIVEHVICELSGTSPSQWCPKQRNELFAADQPPLPKEQDLWQRVLIDTWSGLRASTACTEFLEEKTLLNVTDQAARRWIRRDAAGQSWAEKIGFPPPVTFAPTQECAAGDPRPTLVLAYPPDGQTILETTVSVYALIDAPQDFDFWRLDYGLGDKPVNWETLAQGHNRLTQPDIIANWNVGGFPPGVATLRLVLQGLEGGYVERQIHLILLVPTPTPQPTATPLPTSTPLPTLTPTNTPLPTDTPLPPTETPLIPTPYSVSGGFPKATTTTP